MIKRSLWGMLGLSAWAGALGQEGNPPARALAGHEGSVVAVVFTPDGNKLVSGSRDRTIKIWDLASGKAERILTNHTGAVYSLAFSHDGQWMASGAGDKQILLWDAKK